MSSTHSSAANTLGVLRPDDGSSAAYIGSTKMAHEVFDRMSEGAIIRERAMTPNDLERLFIERANAGDIDGLVALYEVQAVVARDHEHVAIGANEIRRLFAEFLASRPRLDPSNQSEALCSGNLALTSSRLTNGDLTAEVARRQADGSWLWVLDRFVL